MKPRHVKIVKQTIPYVIAAIIINIVIAELPFKLPLPPFLAGIIVASVMRIMVYVKGKTGKKYRKNIEHGSARWGTEKDIKPFQDSISENNIPLTATESITMNSRPTPIKYARNKNILCIGGSGSGKTRFFVKPSLLSCDSKDFPASYVVTDPKGSLIREVGSLLVQKGYKIRVLNLIDFTQSMKYNPFEYIRSEKDILKFVTALIANTNGDKKSSGIDPFWEKAETLLYQALIGYIFYETPPSDQNINSLIDMIGYMEVKEDNDEFRNAIDQIFINLEKEKPRHFAVRQYKKYKLAAGKTAKSILVSCGARLSPFDISEVCNLMSTDELALDKIGDERTAFFVILEDTDDSFSFIAALMYSQLFNVLTNRADLKYKGRLPYHVRFLLDEFPNIGKIPRFEKLIATIRSREMSACVILQTQSQLKALYKDDSETIIGNMDTHLFLGGAEKSTLEEMNKMLGKETIDVINASKSRGQSESNSQAWQKLGRDLMTVDELGKMDSDYCILRIRGTPPFKSKKYNLEKHKNYKYTADHDPRKAFNVKKYLSTQLRMKGDEMVEITEFKQVELGNYIMQ